MATSNGHRREKYDKQCDKHSVTRSEVEWSEVRGIWKAYGGTRDLSTNCV